MVQRIINSTENTKLIWTVLWRVVVSVGIGICTLGMAAFWLFADRHNDDRYILAKEYAKDRANMTERAEATNKAELELRKQYQESLSRRLDGLDAAVKGVADDVKQLHK